MVRMLTKVKTATLTGVEGRVVTVETDMRRGLPSLTIVGLADTTIRESCDRIRPAIMNSGEAFPDGRVTVNLVPAGRRKEGSHFDLPIAVGIMALAQSESGKGREGERGSGCGFCGEDPVRADTAFLGELSLDGTVNRVNGALPLAMGLRAAGVKRIVVPAANAREVSVLTDVDILPVDDLRQAADIAFYGADIAAGTDAMTKAAKTFGRTADGNLDFSQVIGQSTARRAAVIGAAGNHGLLMIGGPGCGKTMIARRIPTIMPGLTYGEKLEITGIYSVAGLLSEEFPVVEERPFRSPHHTISTAALIGGGARPRPGELSLAHRGVLFLDEMGEFDSRAIDAMRQPVEDGYVRINRSMEEGVFPSKVMLVAAANPCKCGNLWDENRVCTCTEGQLRSYRRKLTGPFADRIDMHVKMAPVTGLDMTGAGGGERTSSARMREDVERAAAIQRERYKDTVYDSNGDLDESGIAKFCVTGAGAAGLLAKACDSIGLTMRARGKLLKVSRTIADLDGSEDIKEEHVAEALMYRTVSAD